MNESTVPPRPRPNASRRPTLHRLALQMFGLLLAGLPALGAMAQDGAEEQIPQWIVIVIIVFMGVLLAIASFKSAKRGHQD